MSLFTVLALLALIVLSVHIAASLYFHFTSKLRFPLRRQLLDYSTLLAPYNAFVSLTSALPRRPTHPTTLFPELALLEANWPTIRDEALALLHANAIAGTDRADDLVFYSFMKRGWKRFYLHWYGPPLPSAQRLCPHTTALLQKLPTIPGAMFALLPPSARLGKHRDPFAGTLRYHLGLRTPNDARCFMTVDDHTHVWHDGEGVVFDTSFVHKAKNDTTTPRLVLFCDIERPLRFRLARAINRFTIRHLVPGTATPNDSGDPTGLANRVFASIQPIRRAIAALKTTSAPLYYTLKYTLLIALPLALLAVVVPHLVNF